MDYLQVKEQIKQKLPNPIDFKDTENLLELGLSSLVIMRLVNQWRKQGIKVSFGSLMEWGLSDMFNQLMVIPNAIALFALTGIVVRCVGGDKKQ